MTPCNSESIICAQHFCLNHRIHPHCDHQLPSPTSDWQVRAEVNVSDGSTWGTGGVGWRGLYSVVFVSGSSIVEAPHGSQCLSPVWGCCSTRRCLFVFRLGWNRSPHCDPSLSGCVLTRLECDCQVFLRATCCFFARGSMMQEPAGSS